jgi:hypothetical protein
MVELTGISTTRHTYFPVLISNADNVISVVIGRNDAIRKPQTETIMTTIHELVKRCERIVKVRDLLGAPNFGIDEILAAARRIEELYPKSNDIESMLMSNTDTMDVDIAILDAAAKAAATLIATPILPNRSGAADVKADVALVKGIAVCVKYRSTTE